MKPLPILKTTVFFFLAICSGEIYAQTIGTFSSVTPTVQTQNLVLPVTHTFQRIIKSGDALSLGGTLGNNTDFTGYVPIGGSSRNGYLSISNETTPAGVAILGISYNTSNHLWTVNNGGNVPFPSANMGSTTRFCSGTVTPNGTVIVSEEGTNSLDVNADGYHDQGWLIEINPATRTVIDQNGAGGPDKLWALGKANRENAAIKSDNSVLFTGADDGTNGFLYKFVPTVPGNFSSGLLYVLRTTAGLGSGTWKLLPNTFQAERNGIVAAAAAAPAAYNFNGIEDVEFGPDGRIYFTAKNEGKIYRFTDNGTFGTPTDISGLEVFAGNDAYPTIKSYDVDGAGPIPAEPWGRGNDNLAFDGEGNLWVCQDAIVASDRNHIWVIGPTHTQASPQVRVFATTPTRSESTGITFTPDYNFMFISFMNPTTSNTLAQTDAAGISVVFSTHTTVVIARKSVLGPLSTLPVKFTAFKAVLQDNETVSVSWSVSDVSNHDYFVVERSVNGSDFETIHRNSDIINGSAASFNYTDNNLPGNELLYYRIKQCDINGQCKYSEIRKIKRENKTRITKIYPQPVSERLSVEYYSTTGGAGSIAIIDMNGKTVLQENRSFSKGPQVIQLNTGQFGKGIYMITITDANYLKTSNRFVKE